MGMDVIGKKPTSERGEYFRNNVWWWRPLWDYCCEVGQEVITDEIAESGSFNDGAGLDEPSARVLAQILSASIDSGHTEQWEKNQREWRASLPREACSFCNCTGISTDEVGVKNGMPERELAPEVQILTGRTHGWCNACQGIGTTESWLAQYPFSVENVQEFTAFLTDSGGFEIW